MMPSNFAKERFGKKPEVKKPPPETNGTPPPSPGAKLRVPEIWYEANKKLYWVRNSRGLWTEYPATHVRTVLLRAGLSGTCLPPARLSEVEEKFYDLRSHFDVSFAGQIAGYKEGIHEIFGLRVLITRGPNLIKPERGEWKTLKTFLGELLGEQMDVFMAWLKCSLKSLYRGRPFRPGQALAIAGPPGCGKSFLQGVITELLGGRVAKPWSYLCGESKHNAEMLSSEHLAIEDEAASTDIRTRRFFGARLKNIIANEVAYLNPKGRDAVNVAPFWRVSITLNDEAENLMVLPPFDESIRDKIILLKAYRFDFPFGDGNETARDAYRRQISVELPAFLHHLRGWRIPAKMADKRFGCKAFQNPDLLQQLESLEPEFRLMELIDALGIWEYDARTWEGTAQELRRKLEDKDKRGEVSRLLYYNTAAGVYLARLRQKVPHRVEQRRGEGNLSYWVIRR